MSLKKICRCGKLIDYAEGMCPECKAKAEQKEKQRHKRYKHNRNDKWEQSFYSSTNWERARKIVKNRDNGLCKMCLNNNKLTIMDTVHHIVELKEDRSKALSTNNLICLCESCHQLVHKAYINDRARMQSELRKLINGRGV